MARNEVPIGAPGPGSRKEDFPLFFGDGIFGVLHRPPNDAHSGWVICNPFGMEKTNAHRLNVEWARTLADAGHWVLRFDYRGTGDSAGSFEDSTVHDYIEDIGMAVLELERISGVACGGLLGLRLGAGLAATFAAGSGREFDLAMWEPVVDGGKYRDALLRTAMANEMVNSAGRHRSRDDFRKELAGGRSVSVDGIALAAPMHDSLATLDLEDIDETALARVFVAQINSRPGRPPKPAIAALVKRYSEGSSVELEMVQAPSVWLRTKSYRWRQEELFGKTLGWIGESRSPSSKVSAPVAAETGKIETKKFTERPVGFDVEGEKVWGILHEPLKPRKNSPNIVMTAAGALDRSGIFYTRLAREFATEGWRVLRFDPRGIGDSNGKFECDSVDEVYGKIDAGALVPDTIAALDFLGREYGTGESVLIGLCGGATTSVYTAAADDRVVGIAPLELPLRITPLPDAEKPHPRPDRTLLVDRFSQRRGTLLLLTVRRIVHTARGKARLLRVNLTKTLRLRSGSPSGKHELFRESVGDDANFPMLAAFKTVLAKQLPVFCVFADTPERRLFESALPELIRGESGDASQFQQRVISGAEHTFTMPGQTKELLEALTEWLADPFRPWSTPVN